MSEWLKETGCKPVGYAYAGSNPAPPTGRAGAAALRAQSTSSAAATRSVTVRPRPVGALRWPPAQLAQLVEHFHGKEGVVGSSPTLGFALESEMSQKRRFERRGLSTFHVHQR